MKVLRTLHIGVGGRGRWPLETMGADPRFESVGFVDLVPDNLEKALARHPGVPTFSDADEALTALQPDVAVICTPTRTHAPLSRACFEKGVHVLVEKGMTMSYAEAVALVHDAETAGVKFAVAQNYRYRSNERMVASLQQDPDHPQSPGRIELVDYVHHRYRPQPLTLNYPFAMVWDMSCHHIDSLSCWLGPLRQVTARSSNPTWSGYEHHANIHAILEYESGAVCNYLLTHAATYSDWRIVLQGERGALQITESGLLFHSRPEHFLGRSEGQPVDCPNFGSTEQGVTDDFYRYVVDGIEPGTSGRRNLDTLAGCEMLYRSAAEGRTITLEEIR